MSSSESRRRRRGGGVVEVAGGRAVRGPDDIPDEYVRMIQRMMALVTAWHTTRAVGRPAARFRMPPKDVQIVGVWREAFEPFCLNAEARELAKLMPPDATIFAMRVALYEAG